ncbi:hypothetical protein [Sporolactobacillus vineae]|uniref:hypothetical protein n=1 Tax=Sporolactobacillus vineae TaxID=444463 RepID=UPI000289CADD|nr:hypothetical protein [Sporolactobacillus vineae]
MTLPENLKKLIIPIVDLDRYRFSPPGSMGWSEAEYEELITDPERTIQTETFSPPEVPQEEWVELSVSKDRAGGDLPFSSEHERASDTVDASATVTPPDKRPKQRSPEKKSKQSPEKKLEQRTEELPGKEIPDREKTAVLEVNDPLIEEYVKSPNPPARPWLAKQVTGRGYQ